MSPEHAPKGNLIVNPNKIRGICSKCNRKTEFDISLTLNKAPMILHFGFLNSEDRLTNDFDYLIDLEFDIAPFCQVLSGQSKNKEMLELQVAITIEEGLLGIMSYAVYFKNTKNEWLKANM